MSGCCSDFWMFLVPAVIIWWLFSSWVVSMVWNHVITAVTSAKRMSFKHALLLLIGLHFLLAPFHAQNCWKSGCDRKVTIENNENLFELKPAQ